MKNRFDDRNLGKRLRAERPAPSAELENAIVSRIDGQPRRLARASYRYALAGGLTAALLVGLASVGGISYAANQVTQAAVAVKKTLVSTPTKAARPAAGPPSAGTSQYNGGTPVLSAVSPKQGCLGNTVTIKGNELIHITSVSFNGVSATSFIVKNNNRILAGVPLTTSGHISVSGSNGTAVSSFIFTYLGPKVKKLKPGQGPVGTSVLVQGKCFAGATSVTFNGTSASFTVDSNSQITTHVPALATSGPLSVTTPSGSSEKPFKVTAP